MCTDDGCMNELINDNLDYLNEQIDDDLDYWLMMHLSWLLTDAFGMMILLVDECWMIKYAFGIWLG